MDMTRRLFERVLITIRHYEMLRDSDSVLIAVSGGSDSVFLLHALLALKNKCKLRKLIVCHLDHRLRGEESRQDALFVQKLSRELGLECIGKAADIKK